MTSSRAFQWFSLACSLYLIPIHSFAETEALERIALWPEGVPGRLPNMLPEREDDGWLLNIHDPSLTVIPPTAPGNGTGVIYIPGGGYARVSMRGTYGHAVIDWLSAQGVTVFLLRYRTTEYGFPVPLLDAMRAIRTVRAQAERFQLEADRIGVTGVSAGGHLASCLGTLYDHPVGKTGAEIDRISARPDFLILLFPVITMSEPYVHRGSRRNLLGDHPNPELVTLLSTEQQVTSGSTPAFLVSTAEDSVVPMENSFLFYQALSRAGVPAELHLFAQGQHGYGLDPRNGTTTEWPNLCEAWMRLHGWLEPAREESTRR